MGKFIWKIFNDKKCGAKHSADFCIHDILLKKFIFILILLLGI